MKGLTAKAWLTQTYVKDDWHVRKRAICYDGFSVSIQGGTKGHYCSPRENVNCYILVEVGYPSTPLRTLKQYKDGTCDVYGYVPIELVERIIKRHGGIDLNKSLKGGTR